MANAKCKLRTLELFREKGVPHPEFWTKSADAGAAKWDILVARTTTRGSGGEGIVIIRAGGTIPPAPLYTRYIRKNAEYRIHVMRDEVLMIQQKRRDNEAEQTADQKLIRNYDNGWVFAANNVEFTNDEQKRACCAAAVAATAALGLDFGAVDLCVGRRDGLPYVLEVNTAPGVQSPTLLASYVQAIQKIQGETKYDYNVPKQMGRPRSLPKR